MSVSKEIIGTFEEYQKARVKFAQKIAELSTRPRNIEGKLELTLSFSVLTILNILIYNQLSIFNLFY